jgi:hypothetical protein
MHERSTFFKYMSSNTGKIVLDTCSLRWSSPIIFNDPFDVPREVMPGINEENIGRALAKKLTSELIAPREDIHNLNPKIRTLLEFCKNFFPSGIPAELIKELQEVVDIPSVGLGAAAAIQEMKHVWKEMLNERRILCLSESPLITPMWNHYADEYKGIVIEFDCMDILDSAWLIAKPIKYTNELPLTYTSEGMAELLFMPDNKAMEYINTEITFMKTEEWTYEKEWRISNYARKNSAIYYSDLRFHPLEIKSVILGPRFDIREFEQIASLIKKYPKAKLYKSSFGTDRRISIEPVV